MRGVHLEVARVTLEFDTPFAVGTGAGDDRVDTLCVTDLNGLPSIPGSSLAGVLRHALADGRDPERDPLCRKMFGFQDGSLGQSSRVEVSWAQVHDASDRPVPFSGATKTKDPILSLLEEGVVRDHVAIDHRGVAGGRTKYDESLVPAGARFTFELVVHREDESSKRDAAPACGAASLIGLLQSDAVRIGGRTRRGFGAFRVIRAEARSFDLNLPQDFAAFIRLPRRLEQDSGGLLPPLALEPPSTRGGWIGATLELEPEDHWLFGGLPSDEVPGQRKRRKGRTDRPFADSLPVTERRISWRDGRGRVERVHLAPATGLKGALRHRTAFHARRLDQAWLQAEDLEVLRERPEVEHLFGKVAKKREQRTEGSPGRVFLSDAVFGTVTYGALEHVALDRFTQGPLDRCLFSEAPLYGGSFEIRLWIERHTSVQAKERAALQAALSDLVRGRLAIGAGSNRGHGYVRGRVVWDDQGAWIGGGA
jgi:CRISPR/Cas system CSM-associated protein Csm3 (group 7 of RAMP superfamily)